MPYLDEREFKVGQLVESVHEPGTVYRVTAYIPPGGPYQNKGAAVKLELVFAGPEPDAELGLRAGRMADGGEVAVGHLITPTPQQATKARVRALLAEHGPLHFEDLLGRLPDAGYGGTSARGGVAEAILTLDLAGEITLKPGRVVALKERVRGA